MSNINNLCRITQPPGTCHLYEAPATMRIQTNTSQEIAAIDLTNEGYVCMRHRRLRPGDADYDLLDEPTHTRPWTENWTWVIVRQMDHLPDARRWFDMQDSMARVWYVFRGKAELRYAK